MSKHTAQIRLINARNAYHAASEACPHWDYEGDGTADECCYSLADAKRELRLAQEAVERENVGK